MRIPRDHLVCGLVKTVPGAGGSRQRSPVDGLIVAFRCNDFGGQVVRRAAKRPGDVGDFLCEPEVCDFEMAVPVEQEVLGL